MFYILSFRIIAGGSYYGCLADVFANGAGVAFLFLTVESGRGSTSFFVSCLGAGLKLLNNRRLSPFGLRLVTLFYFKIEFVT